MNKHNVREFKVIINKFLFGTFLSYISISPRKLVFIAPHPDDEIFGLGGTLIRLIDGGSQVYIIYLTDGEGSGIWKDLEEIKKQRILLSEKVIELLGVENSNIYRLHLTDGNVPHLGQVGFDNVVTDLKMVIDQIKPDAVFATHSLDYWPFDHVACAQIAREAVKKSGHKTQLWYYWVWAWYNIRPWHLMKIKFRKLYKIDIIKQMPQKKILMNIYKKAITPDGKPWSGVLPKALVNSFNSPVEIIERII